MINLFGLKTLLEVASSATGAEGAAAGTSLVSTVVMLVLMVGVFYFLLIRPQKKKDKAVKQMLNALKVGDRITTIGGIYGTVTGLRDDQVIIAVGAAKTPMNMARWAVKTVDEQPLENDAEPEV